MKTDFPLKEFGACPTPFYFYDMKLLDLTLDAIIKEKGDFHVHYALKANSNPEIVSHIAARGFGADCVSGGEIQRALDCGVPANKIVFAGVGKTDAEINLALRVGIGCFNVESAEEMQVISALAVKAGTVARIAIRVNPNIDAHTHANITTGLAENKFGINFEMLPATVNLAHSLPGVELTGLHLSVIHIAEATRLL
ncbi:MAG: diaminopimelate decarboxylase, partial [Muribaculaceae bacterium]|nr:diaminopimelate decarboxylase [Muribaculaceae bacterium]